MARFSDSCVHGSTMRQIPGSRRTIIMHYVPGLAQPFEPGEQMYDRLSEKAKGLVAQPRL